MPGMDGTGPMGAGPMTGGGFGRCGRRGQAGLGRGYGRGGGFGGGIRLRQRLCWDYLPSSADEGMPGEKELLGRDAGFLKSRIAVLEESLAAVERKLGQAQAQQTEKIQEG